MDLLGDLGAADQLTSARAENAVLTRKVKELSQKVKELTVENQTLLAEVEIYRKEGAFASTSNCTVVDVTDVDETPEEFLKSGNGVYPSDPAVTLQELHLSSNPLCCALHPDDTILATGGADFSLSLCQWGGALAPTPDAASNVTKNAIRLRCSSPVINLGFSQQSMGKALPVVAAGCMDGSIVIAGYGNDVSGVSGMLLKPSIDIKFAKYAKGLAWSPIAPILAAASADGTILVMNVSQPDMETGSVTVEMLQKLHLSGTVESICFSKDGQNLICYTRDTPYLSFFNVENEFELTKINLNKTGGSAVGGFEDHVSFAVMDMSASPNGKFLALATDASRNIVIDAKTGKQIRNLYGHTNDGFSNPKIAWSSSGQYIFGNTQEDGSICVWDVASATIVKRLEGHANPIRALYASSLTDTLVSTSFDKQVKIWLSPM
mmetsp:Transcript_355/g.516  ORF Transcript_355/g.516 Transcript_355/m.516 type:complete len:435 (-) Transcript_355:133-1437(-)|eukprot:CAMPEP_0194214228 /NCGR_PEP_ID=MMETSP0156-20130528/15391_1 /TAXON_ID=33649 /ORGANISM="Thalassionema nitzschioides, Strain L26-B" /LENGTH=434 /DNA_ID=CAMNT_0038942455 /DNA_START=93 /DNA_END=1397 /DNA_ORIENTATION=-